MSYTPTQQQLDCFWNGLQKSLIEANTCIDLTRPEDLIRIRIFNVKNADLPTYSADVTAVFPFAENPEADASTVSEKDLVAMQKPGKPSRDKLIELYTAAREGRLFVNSLFESKAGQRQVIADGDGNPTVLPDGNHYTPEMLAISNANTPPEKFKTKRAGFFNRIAAFFGSEKAKRICENVDTINANNEKLYRKALEDYRHGAALVNQKPDIANQIFNGMYVSLNYLHAPERDILVRERRLANMGYHAHKTAVLNGIQDIMNASVAENAGAMAGLLKNADAVTPEIKQHAAEIFYMKALENHLTTMLKNKTLTEKELELGGEQAVKGSPAYRKNFNLVCGERFNKAVENLKPEDLRAFAENPQAAADNLYKNLVSSMNDVPAQQPKTRAEVAEVKENAKDVPSVQAPVNF